MMWCAHAQVSSTTCSQLAASRAARHFTCICLAKMSDSISPGQILLNCRSKDRVQSDARLKCDLSGGVSILKPGFRREFRVVSERRGGRWFCRSAGDRHFREEFRVVSGSWGVDGYVNRYFRLVSSEVDLSSVRRWPGGCLMKLYV